MSSLPYQSHLEKTFNKVDLSSKIPGWGTDLDPKNRPAYPKENIPKGGTGAHWSEPQRQKPRFKILKSTEHSELTPVFGTSAPIKGVSGLLRRFAYRYSEGRNAHWISLLLADRIDVIESVVKDLLRGRPDHPIQEMGLISEWKRSGLRSRRSNHRNHSKRISNELFLVGGILGILFIRSTLNTKKSKRVYPKLRRVA